MNQARLSLVFLLGFALNTLTGQFRHLNIEDGLSQSTIFAIAQDANGFMWFSTQKGIDRYDGTKFQLKKAHAQITTSGVDFLHPLNTHSLLFRGDYLGVLNCRTGAVIRLTSIDDKTEIDAIYPANGSFLAVDQQKISALEIKEGEIEKVNSWYPDSVPILQSAYDSPYLFIATRDKIIKYKNEVLVDSQKFDLKTVASSAVIDSLFLLGTDQMQIIVTTPTQLSFKIDTITLNTNTPSAISTMLFDSERRLWIGTVSSGLFLYDWDSKQLLRHFEEDKTQRGALSSNSINCLFESRDGVIWIGTHGGGLNLYQDDAFTFDTYFTGVENGVQTYTNNVYCMAPENDSLFWIGTDRGGLVLYNLNTGVVEVPHSTRHEFHGVFDIMRLKGALHLGTDQGLYRMEKNGNNYSRIREIGGDLIRRCKVFPESGTIWISSRNTAGQEQSVLFDLNFKVLDTIALKPDNTISALYSFKDNRYLIASRNGLYDYNVGEQPGLIGDHETIHFSTITAYNEDTLLLATAVKGLYLYDKATASIDTQTYAVVNQSLKNEVIYEALIDSFKRIWLSTNDGIIEVIDPGRWNRHAAELPFREFNSGGCLLHNGNIYFGGVDGLVGFEPAPPNTNKFDNEWVLEWYYPSGSKNRIGKIEDIISKRLSPNKDTISLPYEFRYLSISAFVPNYRYQEDAQIKFRINDASGWNYLQPGESLMLTQNDFDNGLFSPHSNSIAFSFRLPDSNWSDASTILVRINPWIYDKNIIIIAVLVLSLILLLIVILFLNYYRLDRLNTIKNRINEVSRLDTCEEILKTAGKHFITKAYFDFEAVVIYEIDYVNRRIRAVEGAKRTDSLLNEEENKREVPLKDHDILAQVIQYGETIAVVGNQIWHKELSGKEALDTEVYEKQGHRDLARFFVPIIHRVKSFDNKEEQLLSTKQEGDIPLGLVEFRYKKSIWSKRKLLAYHPNVLFRLLALHRRPARTQKAIRLQFYIDNLAHPYYTAYRKEKADLFQKEILNTETRHIEHPDEFLQAALRKIKDHIKADYAAIGLRKKNTPHINLLEAKQLVIGYDPDDLDSRLQLLYNKDDTKWISITDHVDNTQQTYFTGNAGKDQYYYPLNSKIESEICVPMLGRYYPAGVLMLSANEKSYFNKIHAELLSAIAHELAQEFLRKKRYLALAKLARPYDVFGDVEKEIYHPLVKVSELYFQSDYVALWDRSNRFAVNEFHLSKVSSPAFLKLYKNAGMEEKQMIDFKEKGEFFAYQTTDIKQRFGAFCRDHGFESYIALIIRAEGYNEVFINILSRRRIADEIYFEDRAFAKQLVKKAELAIQSSRLMDSIKNISESLLEDHTKKTLQVITKSAVEALNADIVTLYPYRKGNKIMVKDGFTAGLRQARTNKPDNEAADFPNLVITEGDQWLESDKEYFKKLAKYLSNPIKDRENTFWRKNNLKAVAAKRLVFKNLTLGVMIFNYCREIDFDHNKRKFIEAYADYATIALVNRDIINVIKEEIAEQKAQAAKYQELIKDYKVEKENAQREKEEAHVLMQKMLAAAKKSSFFLILEGMNHEIKHFLMELNFGLEDILNGDFRIPKTDLEKLTRLRQKMKKNITSVEGILRLFNFTSHERHEIHLSQLVKGVVSFFKGQKEMIDYELELKDHISMDAHPAEISIVLYNLLNNATDAVLAKRKKKNDFIGKIKVETFLEKDKIKIKIEDNGIGIDREMIERIMDRGVSTKKQGTGIGLFFVREILEREYGGRLSLESVLGHYTIFMLEFPR